jgi:4a-hydroxytetrahydrobiopterin dehydratase
MNAAANRLLGDDELEGALEGLPGWSSRSGRLHREFRFSNFPEAMAFMTEAAFAAEALEHHPNWSNVYNRVEVELWSHDLGGVSQLCVELAGRMSAIAGSGG